ncbi:unnamed protein product, partial [Fusarium fujikuroi]
VQFSLNTTSDLFSFQPASVKEILDPSQDFTRARFSIMTNDDELVHLVTRIALYPIIFALVT